ncbi:MAG: class I SAM-dependent methyltransferase [Tenacibaculum sp.]
MDKNYHFRQELKPFLNCVDHSVSKQKFKLMYSQAYDMLITAPIPENLDIYYNSENYISHTAHSKNLIEKLYGQIKKYTLLKKYKLINSFSFKGKTILDIGAGTGDFLNICKSKNWQVKGVEPSEKARKIALTKGVVLEKDLNSLQKSNFDIITLWHVLEHIVDLSNSINTIKSLLKPDGVLIIAVPNFYSYDAKFYKEYWAAYDVPRHVWHFSKKSIKKIFSNINMSVERILPMKLDSFYVSLLSEKYKTNKTNYIRAFLIGLLSNLKAAQTNNYSSLIYLIKNK